MFQVERVRETKTFSTRSIRILQRLDDAPGTQARLLALALVDLIEAGAPSLLEYSCRPSTPGLRPPDKLKDPLDSLAALDPPARPESVAGYRSFFAAHEVFIDTRCMPDSATLQSVYSFDHDRALPSDGADPTEHYDSFWCRLHSADERRARHEDAALPVCERALQTAGIV